MGDPVVVGVDGSASSLEAVGVAAHEAGLRDVGLRLVHAFGSPSMRLPPGGPRWSPAMAGVRELVDGTLARAEQRAHAAAPHVEITRDVTVGEPLTVLEIESRTASLVVVGSRGRGAFASLLLGSTAVHLAGYSRCPVLVVRGRPDPGGPVLLAADGSPAGEPAVAFAFTEASLRGTGLVALHVWNTWTERSAEGPVDPLNVVTDAEHLREKAQRLLDDTLSPWQRRFPHVGVEKRLVRSRVRPALIEASRDAQLVVAGARGHGGFTGLVLGSVSQALLHHAHCPVAVVRGEERS
ncbi:universal stress protein [Streptomyces tricolor]|uniref:Universal stress protein n=1 Tax=Streptomyces tricolor TaxID=68277 RepID=A0ABS9J905_9ACTN|nr:universal stress protein [Streptomyces tricolor]MCG0062041.1 universal stress protein [Streptomyces tricolor]